MKLRVKLFAVARQLAGADAVELDLPPAATVGDARRALAERCPALAAWLPRMRFAVGNDYARDDAPLTPESELACIPPVSGG